MNPSLPDRTAWLGRFERLVRSHLDELVGMVAAEMGKSEWEVLSTELMPLLASIRWHRRNLKRLLRPRRLRGGALWQFSQRHHMHRAPLGTVGIIATWNYPLQLLGVQLVQAVSAGNRVVVKPSEHAPWAQQRLLELAREAGLDETQLRWTEASREAGARLLEEEELDHVLFTGSSEVGRAVGAACAQRLVSSTLELSGRDSAFVLEDADMEFAAASIWNAVVMNAGQTCMAPRRVLVMRPGYTAFVNELARMAAAARPVRLVRPEDVTQCTDLVRDAVDAGGRNLLCDNAAIDEHHMRPVAVVDCPREAKLVEGRHFGPIVAVVCCDDFADAMGVHERSDQRLATAIYTRSPSRVRGLAAGFGSGLVTINDCVLPAGHPAAPITGNGASGWGSSQGIEGLLGLTRPVVVSRTGRFLRLPLEVPTDRIQGFLRRFLGGRRAGGDAGTPAGDDGDARGRPPGHDPDSRSEESEEPTIGVH